MESKVHQINWFQRGKYGLYFWNQYRILIYSNLQKSPPWKLKSPPNLVNHNIAPLTHKIAPWGPISPTLNITDVNEADIMTAIMMPPHRGLIILVNR